MCCYGDKLFIFTYQVYMFHHWGIRNVPCRIPSHFHPHVFHLRYTSLDFYHHDRAWLLLLKNIFARDMKYIFLRRQNIAIYVPGLHFPSEWHKEFSWQDPLIVPAPISPSTVHKSSGNEAIHNMIKSNFFNYLPLVCTCANQKNVYLLLLPLRHAHRKL